MAVEASSIAAREASASALVRWGARLPPAQSGTLDAEARRDEVPAEVWDVASPDPAELASVARRGAFSAVAAPERFARAVQRAGHPAIFGLLGHEVLEVADRPAPPDVVWMAYAVTEDPVQRSGLLFALARTGGDRVARGLAVELEAAAAEASPGPWLPELLEAWSILCARGVALPRHPTDLVTVLPALVSSSDPMVRPRAVQALSRCLAPNAERFAGAAGERTKAVLTAALAKDDAELTRLAYRALATLREPPAEVPAWILGPRSSGGTWPWSVELEAVRMWAQTNQGREVLVARLLVADVTPGQLMASPVRVQIWLEALRGLAAAVGTDRKVKDAIPALTRAWVPQLAGGRDRRSTWLRCELLALAAAAAGSRDPLRDCTVPEGLEIPPSLPDILATEAALRFAPDEAGRAARARVLLELSADPRPEVRAPALTALFAVPGAEALRALETALRSDDPGVVAAAAGALAARSVSEGRPSQALATTLLSRASTLTNEHAVEARASAVEAATRWFAPAETGGAQAVSSSPGVEAVRRELGPFAVDPNPTVRRAVRLGLRARPEVFAGWDPGPVHAPPSLPAGILREVEPVRSGRIAGLRFETADGILELRFDGYFAPFAQASLVHLARTGAYDGLTWHRVVPGFVVQGGDPRGDGYGGPGYLLPCEVSNDRFVRGTVGMAHAGRDTGGSQIFITMHREPHLDGRFTAVGHIVEGMERVDAILPHDPIVRVTVVETPTEAP